MNAGRVFCPPFVHFNEVNVMPAIRRKSVSTDLSRMPSVSASEINVSAKSARNSRNSDRTRRDTAFTNSSNRGHVQRRMPAGVDLLVEASQIDFDIDIGD